MASPHCAGDGDDDRIVVHIGYMQRGQGGEGSLARSLLFIATNAVGEMGNH